MAFAATTEWEVRTTGSDTNGGGFDTASTGTDYSQQDAAQVAYTDLVIGNPTTTQLTSALNPFTALHVGNIVNITGGTGFTVGRYQVVSVATNVATMDRAVGTAGSTGGTGNLGGAVATIATANGAAVASNTIHVKVGTYNITAAIAVTLNGLTVIGFNATHRDGGTRPLITTATNSVHCFTVSNSLSGTSGKPVVFDNLSLSSTAGVRGSGIVAVGGAYPSFVVRNSVLDGFNFSIDADNATFTAGAVVAINNEIKNCTQGIANWFDLFAVGNYIHNCTSHGINWVGGNSFRSVILIRNVISYNGGSGVIFTSTGLAFLVMEANIIAHNTGDGFNTFTANSLPAYFLLVNNIIYSNGGYGINDTAGTNAHLNRNNAYGANTSGARRNLPAGLSDVTLSATPFVNAAGGDLSLNSTVGGGAACRLAGFQRAMGTAAIDIGAIQTSGGGAPGGGGGGAFAFIA